MKKQCLKELFDKIMKEYHYATSLISFTEAVFISNPSPERIRNRFYKWVDPKDYEGLKARDVLRDTFTDLLDGARTKECERLALENFMSKEEIHAFYLKYPFLAEK